jgi:signal transduction histidine kinase
MAALHGYLQLVERSIATTNRSDIDLYTSRALAQTRRMGELVERLFDVSRIQSGQLQLVVGPLDIVDIVGRAIEVSEGLPDVPPVHVIRAPRSLRLNGDAGRLEQVFVNVLGNAVEHADGTPTIEVSISRSGRSAVVEVRDSGPGIAAAELPLVFQPYVRIGGKRTAGLGLGLYLAREIVTAHDGTIEIASRRRHGTTITVRLPVAGPSARTIAARRRTSPR